MKIRRLREPIQIGTMHLEHRMIMPAMWVRTATKGFATEHTKLHYQERAKDRPSLIIIGAWRVDYAISRLGDDQLSIDDDRFMPGLRETADIINHYGPKAAL